MLLIGVLCSTLFVSCEKPHLIKWYVGPQSAIYLPRPEQYMALFPEICHIKYADMEYSFRENRFGLHDYYSIKESRDSSLLMYLGVHAYTQPLDDKAEYVDGTGILYMQLRADLPHYNEEGLIDSGEYDALLMLDPYIWQEGEKVCQSDIVLKGYPCTLVVEDVSIAERQGRFDFRMRVKAHIQEADVNGFPLDINFNIKFQ